MYFEIEIEKKTTETDILVVARKIARKALRENLPVKVNGIEIKDAGEIKNGQNKY